MKKELVCVYLSNFIMGGIESYYIRMFEWAKKVNCKATLIILEGNYVHKNWKDKLASLGVEICFYHVGIFKNYIINEDHSEKIFRKETSYQVIVTDIHSYLKMYLISKRQKLKRMSILLYSFWITNGVGSVKKLLNKPFIPFFKAMKNSALVMMDEECKAYCERGNNISLSNESIYRLGLFVPEYNQRLAEHRKNSKNEKPVILSISRMDFPFKGYVLGLLDTYERLKIKWPMLRLTIIGKGPGSQVIREKISRMKEEIKKDIVLVDEVPYDELGKYFETSHIYVGMGTTLLDAAITGLVGIVATANQYKAITPGFFKDHYNNLSGNIEFENTSKMDIGDCIEYILNCSADEYELLAEGGYDCIKNNYNIEKIMPQLMSRESYISFDGIWFKILLIYADWFAAHKYWKKDRGK